MRILQFFIFYSYFITFRTRSKPFLLFYKTTENRLLVDNDNALVESSTREIHHLNTNVCKYVEYV